MTECWVCWILFKPNEISFLNEKKKHYTEKHSPKWTKWKTKKRENIYPTHDAAYKWMRSCIHTSELTYTQPGWTTNEIEWWQMSIRLCVNYFRYGIWPRGDNNCRFSWLFSFESLLSFNNWNCSNFKPIYVFHKKNRNRVFIQLMCFQVCWNTDARFILKYIVQL